MIFRYAVYLLESAILSIAYWMALMLVSGALKRLGRAIPIRPGRAYLVLGLAVFIVNSIASEWLGPDFILLYKLALLAPVVGALFWMFARLRGKIPYGHSAP